VRHRLPAGPSQPKVKRSFKEIKELEQLPLRIEALETQLAGMASRMTQPDYYQRDAALVTVDNIAMASAQAELDAAYLRWEQLEGS
jgi:ATP-binding cassette subfamily F protein uup